MRGPLFLPMFSRAALATAALLTLGACQQAKAPDAESSTLASDPIDEETGDPDGNSAVIENAVDAKKSVIRPEIVAAPSEKVVLEPLRITVPFPSKAHEPDESGRAMIDGMLAAPTFNAGGPIILRGHSDSRGSDRDNLIASRRRAEAVRDYLVLKGVNKDRITVIAIGEGRPVAPNRKPDGSEDPEGQARNRRVEIEVDLPAISPESLPSPKQR